MIESIKNYQSIYMLNILFAIVSAVAIMYIQNYYNRKYEKVKKAKNEKIHIVDNSKNVVEKTPEFIYYDIITMLRINIISFTIYTIISLITFMVLTYLQDMRLELSNINSKIILYTKMSIIPILISIFLVDMKNKIIPNRLTLILFEIAAISIVFLGIFGNSVTTGNYLITNGLFGMVAAFAIFAIMAILGRVLIGKEGLGIGDIKLMTVIGIILGPISVLEVTLVSFILATIYTIGITIFRKIKGNDDDYIAFAPFLVSSIMISLFIKSGSIINLIN